MFSLVTAFNNSNISFFHSTLTLTCTSFHIFYATSDPGLHCLPIILLGVSRLNIIQVLAFTKSFAYAHGHSQLDIFGMWIVQQVQQGLWSQQVYHSCILFQSWFSMLLFLIAVFCSIPWHFYHYLILLLSVHNNKLLMITYTQDVRTLQNGIIFIHTQEKSKNIFSVYCFHWEQIISFKSWP